MIRLETKVNVIERPSTRVLGPYCRINFETIDLNSSTQVKDYLLSVGWVPTEYNRSKKTGEITSPKLTEDSFESIGDDTGQLVARRNILVHRRRTILNYDDPENKGILAQIREEDNRAPALGVLCGTPTGRTTHRGAVCNVPKASKKVVYGKEMRSLYCCKSPYLMLGADLDQIEARVTGHYAAKYDKGVYAKEVLDGDIHQKNADLIGSDRDTAKSFQYAIYYGARAPKLAGIVGCNTRKAGKLITDFWDGNYGVKMLVDRLTDYYKTHGFIKGLDGRQLKIRAEYKLLNSLIQSAAGIVFKRWGVITNRKLRAQGIDCHQIIAYHDEFDYRCHPDHVEIASQIIKESAIEAGEYYNMAVPITVDIKVGSNWSEVH